MGTWYLVYERCKKIGWEPGNRDERWDRSMGLDTQDHQEKCDFDLGKLQPGSHQKHCVSSLFLGLLFMWFSRFGKPRKGTSETPFSTSTPYNVHSGWCESKQAGPFGLLHTYIRCAYTSGDADRLTFQDVLVHTRTK